MDFVARIGVERLTDGRLRAAGFMSTMLEGMAVQRVVVNLLCWKCRRGRIIRTRTGTGRGGRQTVTSAEETEKEDDSPVSPKKNLSGSNHFIQGAVMSSKQMMVSFLRSLTQSLWKGYVAVSVCAVRKGRSGGLCGSGAPADVVRPKTRAREQHNSDVEVGSSGSETVGQSYAIADPGSN